MVLGESTECGSAYLVASMVDCPGSLAPRAHVLALLLAGT